MMIMVAGEIAEVSLGKLREKLDGMLYKRYSEKLVINSSPVQSQNLPPKSAMACH